MLQRKQEWPPVTPPPHPTGQYDAPGSPTGPAYTMAGRTHAPQLEPPDSPGPAAYGLPQDPSKPGGPAFTMAPWIAMPEEGGEAVAALCGPPRVAVGRLPLQAQSSPKATHPMVAIRRMVVNHPMVAIHTMAPWHHGIGAP